MMVLYGGITMKEPLERIVKSKNLFEAATACANSCTTDYQSRINGYRVCTLSRDQVCKYSGLSEVNQIVNGELVLTPNVPPFYTHRFSIQRYQTCSKGIIPVSEIVQRTKDAFSLWLVKGYWDW
jgi:hypothetical protein